jgi:hypothetical protein
MLKWVTANLGVLLLVALTAVTTLPISSIAALWLGFLYQRNAAMRRYINGALAEFSTRETLMSAQVRFAVQNDVDYARLEQAIRDYYVDAAEASVIHTLKGQDRMDVDAPGWRMRLELSTLADDELENGEIGGRRDLLISVPETLNSVRGTKKLVSHHVLPLLNQLQKDLGIAVQAAELKIRFAKGVNPYLSIYFQNQNTGQRSIRALNCVLEASKTKGRVTLAADSVTLSAPDLFTLSNLADEHLVMFRAAA